MTWRASPLWLLLPGLALSACATMPGESGPEARERALEVLDDSADHSAPAPPAALPEEVAQELLDAPRDPGAHPDEPLFDLRVDDAEARGFFTTLVEDTPYSVVVHPEVEGRISLHLRTASIPEIMATVEETHGYRITRRGATYHVGPAGLQTRTFFVDYLNVERSGRTGLQVNAGQLAEGEDDEPRGTLIRTSSESSFWGDLRESLEMLVRGDSDDPTEGRRVIINPNTGVVAIRALPDELRDVGAFLDAVQSSAQRQVILEAKVLEVALDSGFEAGINWASLGSIGSFDILLGQTGGGQVGSDNFGRSPAEGEQGRLNPANRDFVDGTQFETAGGLFSAAIASTDFSAMIELMETQGDVTVLSSPRVSTVNNQKAVIKVGNDRTYITDFQLRTESTGDIGRDRLLPDPTFSPIFDGVALDVTPQIGENGDVILHVRPSVSEVRERITSFRFDGDEYAFPLASSAIRESDSVVRARNGQVVIIGGMMQDTTQETLASTPFMSEIPLLGELFRHTRQEQRKSELVILLRPLVVDPDGDTWETDLDRTRQRLRDWDGADHRVLEM